MLGKPKEPNGPIEERKSRMWNCWARTSRCPGGDGVITHVFEEGTERGKTHSICGVVSYDGGGMNMLYDEGYTPGCFKCRKLLRKWGLMPDQTETTDAATHEAAEAGK